MAQCLTMSVAEAAQELGKGHPDIPGKEITEILGRNAEFGGQVPLVQLSGICRFQDVQRF